jgi:alkyl sulfatase BDS1-like metallo-beta-lactamase superfamily hydrolase
LNKLGSLERSATSRNWFLTQSLEIQSSLDLKPSLKQIQQTVRGSPIRNTLKFFAVRFNYETAQGIDQLVLFEFLDTKVKVSLHLRNGIVDFQEHWPEEIDQEQTSMIFQVKSEEVWKNILCRELSPIDAIENFDIIVQQRNGESHPEGGLLFIQFLLFFIEQ